SALGMGASGPSAGPRLGRSGPAGGGWGLADAGGSRLVPGGRRVIAAVARVAAKAETSGVRFGAKACRPPEAHRRSDAVDRPARFAGHRTGQGRSPSRALAPGATRF